MIVSENSLMGISSRPPRDLPTIEAPAHGVVSTVINDRELTLSEAEYWVAGGTHVVRSREFGFIGEGSEMESALTEFGDAFYAYADNLERRVAADEATDNERESFGRLTRRLAEIYLEERRQPAQTGHLFKRRRPISARSSWRDTGA